MTELTDSVDEAVALSAVAGTVSVTVVLRADKS